MARILTRAGCLVALCLAVAYAPAAEAFAVPPNDGFVTDVAGILTPEEQDDLERTLTDERDATGHEIAVLIVSSLDGTDIAQAALDTHRAWQVGSQANDNGVVVVLAYTERKVWISTGYGAEGPLPDLAAHAIADDVMVPLFRDGKYAAGLTAGVEAIRRTLAGEALAIPAASDDLDLPSLLMLTAFIGLNVLRFFGFWLARSRAWWHGGVIGLVMGAILAFILHWWWPVFLLTVAGLIFDYFVSRYGWSPSVRRRGGWHSTMGGGGFGRGGGFSGFGGGSSGGGGGGSSW